MKQYIYIYIYIYTHLGVKLIWLNFKDPMVPRHGKTGGAGGFGSGQSDCGSNWSHVKNGSFEAG